MKKTPLPADIFAFPSQVLKLWIPELFKFVCHSRADYKAIYVSEKSFSICFGYNLLYREYSHQFATVVSGGYLAFSYFLSVCVSRSQIIFLYGFMTSNLVY